MRGSSCCEPHGMGGGRGGHEVHGGHGGHHGHHGCCCHPGRHFITHAEMLEHLEKYREQVELELKGIDEHIEMLKSGG